MYVGLYRITGNIGGLFGGSAPTNRKKILAEFKFAGFNPTAKPPNLISRQIFRLYGIFLRGTCTHVHLCEVRYIFTHHMAYSVCKSAIFPPRTSTATYSAIIDIHVQLLAKSMRADWMYKGDCKSIVNEGSKRLL